MKKDTIKEVLILNSELEEIFQTKNGWMKIYILTFKSNLGAYMDQIAMTKQKNKQVTIP